MTPYISLIVPVYNVADHVAACLSSIASQTFTDFEVIVIDDGSTDGSGDIAKDTISGDQRFVFQRTENAGLSAARNTGLSLSSADLLGFIDSDDRIAPDYLEKLIKALEASKADWVSSGIEFHKSGEKPMAHSAMHGQGKMESGAEPTRHSLEDWCDVIQHFPSVWNKIYRREILDDIRFDEGLNYEDHAFFWRYAARTNHLLRLSDPLYLSTQGREGQITRDGSDRVFQQFEVLDILESIAAQSEKSGQQAALARIATRLSFERAEAIQDRQRRGKFLGTARNWLQKRQLQPDPKLGVPAYWEEALKGISPLSVVVPTNGDLSALKPTLESLASQTLREVEVLVVPDEVCCPTKTDTRNGVFSCAAQYPRTSVIAGGHGLSSARNRGLQFAQGQTVVFLDAGDTLAPQALATWHNRLRKADADVGLARLRMGDAQTPHSGWHDVSLAPKKNSDGEIIFDPTGTDILGIHGHPSAKIFDRGLLEKIGGFPDGALSTTHFLFKALCTARRAVQLTIFPARIAIRPETRTQWRTPISAGDLQLALANLANDTEVTLPDGGMARLWARLVWEKINFAELEADQRAEFEAEVGRISRDIPHLHENTALDPFIGARVRKLLGLSDASAP